MDFSVFFVSKTLMQSQSSLINSLGMMPCYSARENAISVKLVCLMPENGKYNKPTHIVYIALFNAQTGVLEAIMVIIN